MALQMQRAFSPRMLISMSLYSSGGPNCGYLNEFNEWIENPFPESTIKGVLTSGNKFSQFDKGIALQATESGDRFSDYRTLYVRDVYLIVMQDKIGFDGKYYNVLQQAKETIHGFQEYLLESDKVWSPNV